MYLYKISTYAMSLYLYQEYVCVIEISPYTS